MRAPRSALLQHLRQSFWTCLPQEGSSPAFNRRRFIQQSALAGVALSSLGLTACASSPNKKRRPDIAILGAGLAGLTAAYYLKQQGVAARIFDASDRVGGRVRSAQNLLGDGLTTELGGEFIDSSHEDILHLVQAFKLPLLDTAKDTSVEKYVFYFKGTHYGVEEFVSAFKPFSKSILQDIDDLPDEITYATTGKAKHWDNISITQYLRSKKLQGWLLELLLVAFTTEYGLDADEQSALNFLVLFDPARGVKDFEMFGDSDERFKIDGGNQRLVDALAEKLPDIYLSYHVEKISNAGPGYRVLFRNGEDIYFDYIICTLPFSTLRQVDLQLSGLSALKRAAINELGYGTNAKFFLGFNKRLWRELGFSGQVFSDTAAQLAWDNSQMQPGNAGGLTVFTGGSASAVMLQRQKHVQANTYLKALNKVFPSLQQFYNGQHGLFYWPEHPYTLGSYACYRVGQMTRFAGVEAEPVGNVLFAGEHCSLQHQGMMNGAAQTGRLAAEALLKRL